METLTPQAAREFMAASAAQSPPGPEVGEIVDGTLPGAAGDLHYRLYRPATEGPHPIVVYYHGGGWVLGHESSDDPYCRDLCLRSNALVVSVDYRHAPEARFPAAGDDAFAALKWIAANAESLGGDSARLAVAGWSAGGNLAAVVCQLAHALGGPEISGQVLINPATDCDLSRPSYTENAEGYILTRGLMEWFLDHYCDEADRQDPRVSPLRAESLSGLPPALVITAELDPLRDGGNAYAAALQAASVPVRHIQMPGQIHTSLTAVGMMVSCDSVRAEIGDVLQDFFGAESDVETKSSVAIS